MSVKRPAKVRHSPYAIYICGPSDCPNDERFEHDNYFGCIPRDFNQRTGRSKTISQKRGPVLPGTTIHRYFWDGGCKAIELAALMAEATS